MSVLDLKERCWLAMRFDDGGVEYAVALLCEWQLLFGNCVGGSVE